MANSPRNAPQACCASLASLLANKASWPGQSCARHAKELARYRNKVPTKWRASVAKSARACRIP
eukprot:2901816-Lingulodinium_polyedra.AAC.1